MKDIRELFLSLLILINIIGVCAIDLVLYNKEFTCSDKDNKLYILLINVGPMFFSFILIIDFFLYGTYGICSNCDCKNMCCIKCFKKCELKDFLYSRDDDAQNEDEDDNGLEGLGGALYNLVVLLIIFVFLGIFYIMYLFTKGI